MKPSISKETRAYLDSLAQRPDEPDYHYQSLDAIDQLIYQGGLRIKHIYFDKELELMLVILNNRKVIKRAISDFKHLNKATAEQLENYENDGTGVHWPDVDEDLGLYGFLRDEIAFMDISLVA